MDNEKVIYPDLSYKIVGIAFKIFNEVGFGMPEKFYQLAFAKELEIGELTFEREKLANIVYKDNNIGRYFLDFLVDNKVVVELKVRPRFGYVHIRQVLDYLKVSNHKLAIIIYFTKDGVKYKRVLNA
ncbi:MAG: hypothetical protein A2360_03945 [Candidatus Staskawiczbacteria bacterium RIFOXYB1_FULL_32_11]|uniref:GxxExxY protein n=1 Tax=Candidatus Staskawiczbacteria bacterium RIFOXYD1_FULL_32_13 TaxID=1802234 RepID=A0A1G2JPD7_9BACT|nr:MAG: hypothetical protein UR22_C0010G0008 [Parcubacteria group bacterium GW2011_GWC2_32_10]OGZ79149.1 MAG: hypothetical protein A2360_03945 [Candidatus Staskawiczbacteria bacterium RIFOXYB1_FULL_32_11]OGZ87834.1 MAG: hypothetical protein A2463_03440 [Candidatus Staskawiczbacteria bacterium RIFOXYC2_FULL_32_10]OGZ88823.1 MAG: hypothetical protein A2561_05030 [Candidatus Staskawiczbacteria bacterium RIFOXYD1_FULL_32_13]